MKAFEQGIIAFKSLNRNGITGAQDKWNNCYRVPESTNIDFSSAVAKLKKIIKFALLSTQKLYENNIWCPPNYDISEIGF